MIKKILTNLKAFTLVELVMVMVIVGLLAAIIVPKFTSQKDQAGIAATKANLENLRTAVAMYYAQEGEWPSVGLGELTTGGATTGAIYMRIIPDTQTYDPAGSSVTPDNTVIQGTTATNAGGWYWNYSGGTPDYVLHPNLSGNDANLMAFSDY